MTCGPPLRRTGPHALTTRRSAAPSRRALGVVLTVVALWAVGCGGDEEAAPEWLGDLDTEELEIEPRRDTETTVPVTVSSDDLPELDTTGDDFDRIWREIEAFETSLLRNPDPDLLPEVYVEGTEIHGEVETLLADLVALGAYVVVEDYEIRSVEVVEPPSDGTVILRYTDFRSAFTVVDRATDEVLKSDEFSEPLEWELTLEQGDDDRWRIAAIEQVTDDG